MDWKNRMSSIVNKVRMQLFSKRVEHFSWLYQCIHQFDPEGHGSLTIHDFNLFLNKIGVFLSTQELRTIRDHYDYQGQQRIYYSDFLNNIRNDMSEKVGETIRDIFRFLDYRNMGKLDIQDLMMRYRPQEHPHAASRTKLPESIQQEFQTALKLKSSDGKFLNQKDFIDFYNDLNACIPAEREDYFLELLLKTWGMTHGKDHVTAKRLQQIQDILFEKIRQKTGEKFSQGHAAKAAFKYFDLADKGECDLENFTKALDKFGCKFATNEIVSLFTKYDTNNSGSLSYQQFCMMFSAIGARGPCPIENPLTTLGKNSIGFNQLKITTKKA